MLLAVASGFAQTIPITPNIGLQVPLPGTANWDVPLDYNFNRIDSLLSGNSPLPALNVFGQALAPKLTTWTAMVTYSAGQIVFVQGIAYASITNGNVNNEPPNTGFWTTTIAGGGGSGATFPGTNGIVFNTSPIASRNATSSDLVNLLGFTPAPLASPAFIGTPTAPVVAVSTNNGSLATTSAVTTALAPYALTSALAAYAPLANPTFSGTVQISGSTSGVAALSASATGGNLNLGSTSAVVTPSGALTVASCTGCTAAGTYLSTGGNYNSTQSTQTPTYFPSVGTILQADGFPSGGGTYKGAWSSTATYNRFDTVTSGGVDWIAVNGNINVTPAQAAAGASQFWAQFDSTGAGLAATQADAAFYWAWEQVQIHATGFGAYSSVGLHFGSKVGGYAKNGDWVMPNNTFGYTISLFGDGRGQTRIYQTASTLNYMVSAPNINSSGGQTVQGIVLDANLLAGGCFSHHLRRSFISDVVCWNPQQQAGGTIASAFQLGQGADSYETLYQHLLVRGPSYSGLVPAVGTATITSGAVTGITFTVNGTNLNLPVTAGPGLVTYFTGKGAGGQPCTVMPGQPTYTLTSGSISGTTLGSGGSGCSGTIYVRVQQAGTLQYAFQLGGSDTTYDDIVTSGDFTTACEYVDGPFALYHEHPYCGAPYQIQSAGGGTRNHYGPELDSPIEYGMYIQGSGANVFGEFDEYNEPTPYGAGAILIDAAATNFTISGGGCYGGATQALGGYAKFTGTTAGVITSTNVASVFPASANVTGTIENCDGTASLWGNWQPTIQGINAFLGASGTLGSLTFGNATSGTLRVIPQPGVALTGTFTIPNVTDTAVVLNATQAMTNKTFPAGVAVGGTLAINGSASGSASISATATGGTLNLGSTNATVTSAGALTVSSCTGCGGGAVYPSTPGVVYNTSTSAARNAAPADFLSLVGYYTGAYSSGTTYKFGDEAVDGSGNNYVSLSAGNVGNALTNTTFWHFLGGLSSTITGGNCVTTGQFMLGISTVGVPNCAAVTYLGGAAVPASQGLIGTNSSSQLITPSLSSATLAGYLTDETGTGSAVFSASPALTGTPTAPTATTGTNTTQVATTAFVQANVGTPSLVSGYQALYQPYKQGTTSATTLTDYSSNAYTATFGASTAAPTWLASGAGITCTANQYVAIPSGVLSGAGTIQMWFALSNPQYNDIAGVGPEIMLSDSNNMNIATEGSYNGQVITASGSSQPNARGTDRFVNNSGVTFTYNGSTILEYIDGRPVSGYLPAISGTNAISWTGTGAGNICNLAANAGYGASMTFYGLAVYSTVLTPAQIAANDSAFKSLIKSAAGVSFPTFQPPSVYVVNGDSRIIDYQTYGLTESTPYLTLHSIGVDNYTNLGVGGQTEATALTNIATREYPLFDGNTTGVQVAWNESATNDLALGTSAATIITSLQSYCSTLHARYPGIKVIVNTPPPRSDVASSIETVRETLVSTLVSDWVGGTLGCDSLADEGEDMLAVNSTSPNPFVTSSAYNATYYADGIHYKQVLAKEIASQDACSVQDVLGRMYQPCWIHKTIPYTALSEYGAVATKLATILQLGPNWQVCGVKEQITTPFVGTSITALTASFGDSTGMTSQYLTSNSLLSASSALNLAPNFSSTHGVVQGTFTATGGNLSALTAGSMSLDVCVVDIP